LLQTTTKKDTSSSTDSHIQIVKERPKQEIVGLSSKRETTRTLTGTPKRNTKSLQEKTDLVGVKKPILKQKQENYEHTNQNHLK